MTAVVFVTSCVQELTQALMTHMPKLIRQYQTEPAVASDMMLRPHTHTHATLSPVSATLLPTATWMRVCSRFESLPVCLCVCALLCLAAHPFAACGWSLRVGGVRSPRRGTRTGRLVGTGGRAGSETL